jgi:hypothetical protein
MVRFGFTTRVVLSLLAFSLVSALLPADPWSTSVAPSVVESAPEDVELGGTTTGQGFCSRTAFNVGLSPTHVQAGQPVTARAQGFNAGTTVTFSIKGPTSDTLSATVNQACVAQVQIPTAGDPSGTYVVTFTGVPFAAEFPSNWERSYTVTGAPTASPTHTSSPTATPLPPTATPTRPPNATPITCPPPAVSLLSSRIVQGNAVNYRGRGFNPDSSVVVDVIGPAGAVGTVILQANAGCEVASSIPGTDTTGYPAGRYVIVLTGVSSSGSSISPRAEFDIIARNPSDPLPTDVPTPAPVLTIAPTPTDIPAGVPIAPIAVNQTLEIVGGNPVPAVGEQTDYLHVIRMTNTSSATQHFNLAADVGRGLVFAANLAQSGHTLTLTTDYAPDTIVVSSSANTGSVAVQGSSVTWNGSLAAGQSLELRTNLAQTPTTAFALNSPVRGQSLSVADPRGVALAVPRPQPPRPPPAARLIQPPPPPVDPLTGSRFVPETGFSVVDESIWTYYVRRGAARTFGPPISRLMLLNGAWVQLFEKGMLQTFEDGRVVSVNLLEPPYLPYESFADVTLPAADEGLILGAPDPAAPGFATAAQDFVQANAPEQYEALATRFYSTFMGTVLFRDAFFDGRGDPNLVPGFNLEIWGLPTSRPTYQAITVDQVDPSIALLRYQRGLMRHDSRTGTTAAVPLGYYLRAIIAGDTTQAGLGEVAGGSPLWAQYDPEGFNGVARPSELAETNLALVFTREDDGSEAVPIAPRVAPAPLEPEAAPTETSETEPIETPESETVETPEPPSPDVPIMPMGS